MNARYFWTAVALLILIINHFLALAGRPAMLIWVLVGGYGLFGAVLLGTISRWWSRGSPLVWRPAMLSIGALCAAGEIAVRGGAMPEGTLADQWMVALLGLLGAAIAARVIPDRYARVWLGIDRRVANKDE